MNLFKHIVFISLISLFLCACMTKTEKRDTTFNVSPSQVTWKDKFVFDDCIALNGNDSIPLSTISKCLIDDNQFRKVEKFSHIQEMDNLNIRLDVKEELNLNT